MSHVLKTDDDMFINTDLLLEKLHYKDTFTFYGSTIYTLHAPPMPLSPPYVSGGAYAFTGDVAQEVYYNALETSYFQIEDAFINGFVRQVINATLILIKDMFLSAYSPGNNMCRYMKYISVHGLSSSELIDLYKHDIMKEKMCGIPEEKMIIYPDWIADPGFPGPPR